MLSIPCRKLCYAPDVGQEFRKDSGVHQQLFSHDCSECATCAQLEQRCSALFSSLRVHSTYTRYGHDASHPVLSCTGSKEAWFMASFFTVSAAIADNEPYPRLSVFSRSGKAKRA
ncbi:unnamed protein product [Effrenium voratum]|uniref:Uncharacterized protein n=1 Tax=Effrenium voratum TaxID=2562239 RepID=A0AA36NEZ2_9DINO|nr:unnamed protein product [Effrenium voratum]